MHASAHVPAREKHASARRSLIGLLLFNGIGAVFGGIGLLTESIGMPAHFLDGTPFDSYLVPGLILLIVVAGTSLLAAGMLVSHARHAEAASLVAGAMLLGWIVVEFAMIPAGWLFQLVYFAIALVILWLAWQELPQRD